MHNINYPLVTGLPGSNDLKNNASPTERSVFIAINGLIKRRINAVVFSKLGGRIKLSFGIIYFFSLIYFMFILMT